jgi:hypothetical protein
VSVFAPSATQAADPAELVFWEFLRRNPATPRAGLLCYLVPEPCRVDQKAIWEAALKVLLGKSLGLVTTIGMTKGL